LRSGIGAIDVSAIILEVNEREVNVEDETKKVFSGILADETGKAQFTSWHDFKIKKGDVLRITGGYVKSWKGIPQLTFDERAKVSKLDKNKISQNDLKLEKIPMHKLIEKRGALDVEVEGDVIEIRPGSGIIIRCSECNRTLQNGECSIHGKVEGITDLRLKLIVDDGTGSISTVIKKEITEKLIDKSFEECKKTDEKDLLDEFNKKLFAHKISIRGNALGDEFGTSIIARDAKRVDENIKEEAEKISEKIGDLL